MMIVVVVMVAMMMVVVMVVVMVVMMMVVVMVVVMVQRWSGAGLEPVWSCHRQQRAGQGDGDGLEDKKKPPLNTSSSRRGLFYCSASIHSRSGHFTSRLQFKSVHTNSRLHIKTAHFTSRLQRISLHYMSLSHRPLA